jgi:ribosomal protein S18 acetylase RimI-like enzyme
MPNPLDFLINGSRFTTTRPASSQDREGLIALIHESQALHRHLDWMQPLDWLGSEPFWLMENTKRIQAALALPPDPPGAAWIHLFACLHISHVQEAWESLLEKCVLYFRDQPTSIVAIGLSTWFTRLLANSGFKVYQDIVVLQANLLEGFANSLTPPEVVIRPVQSADMEQVLFVDQKAFECIWQVSAAGLEHACQAAAYTSVALIDGKVVGYQLSTSIPHSAHLARLAVLPEYQGLGIGSGLVHDLRKTLLQADITELTVNTQDSNSASLHLYQKLGFHLTDERFPVLMLQ